MKKFTLLAFILGFGLFMSACEEKSSGDTNEPDSTATAEEVDPPQEEATTSFSDGGLKIYALEGSTQYPDAKLSLEMPPSGTDLPSGENMFKFVVENYQLGEQTPAAVDLGMANSPKGQHIHFILDNSPYSAHYEPEFTKELTDGHHVLLAFLSRSYHESVKNPDAFVVRQFVVGEPEGGYQEADLNAPHMFYSRPKGTYKYGDYDKLLLDFFLVNCDLSPDGYRVKATINSAEFTFTKYVPYVVEGLQAGETTIKLELLDADGNLVDSPFNPVERTVTLEAAEM